MADAAPSADPIILTVGAESVGLRLDTFLALKFPDFSRVLLRRAITAGGVRVDGNGGKPAYRLKLAQVVSVCLPELPRNTPRPEPIPLEIIYQDDYLAVVNKPPGMVVHPARGHWSGTLAGAVQYHFGEALSLAGGPTRPGIVHRLDRDTSGAILVARSDLAHHRLARQFHDRTIEKQYFALVAGQMDRDADLIDCPIGIHPQHREKMAIRRHDEQSRPAQTYYETVERFRGFAAVRVSPKTGRTHQIRVHLHHIGCPVLCDRQYGGRAELTLGELSGDPSDSTVLLNRQALHAARLRFLHPAHGRVMEIEAPLAGDIQTAWDALRRWRS